MTHEEGIIQREKAGVKEYMGKGRKKVDRWFDTDLRNPVESVRGFDYEQEMRVDEDEDRVSETSTIPNDIPPALPIPQQVSWTEERTLPNQSGEFNFGPRVPEHHVVATSRKHIEDLRKKDKQRTLLAQAGKLPKENSQIQPGNSGEGEVEETSSPHTARRDKGKGREVVSDSPQRSPVPDQTPRFEQDGHAFRLNRYGNITISRERSFEGAAPPPAPLPPTATSVAVTPPAAPFNPASQQQRPILPRTSPATVVARKTRSYQGVPIDTVFTLTMSDSLVRITLEEMLGDGDWDPSTGIMRNAFTDWFIHNRHLPGHDSHMVISRSPSIWKIIHAYLIGYDILPISLAWTHDAFMQTETQAIRNIMKDAYHYQLPGLYRKLQVEIGQAEAREKALKDENVRNARERAERDHHPRYEADCPVWSMRPHTTYEMLEKWQPWMRMTDSGIFFDAGEDRVMTFLKVSFPGVFVRCWLMPDVGRFFFELPKDRLGSLEPKLRQYGKDTRYLHHIVVNQGFTVDNYRESPHGLCAGHGFHYSCDSSEIEHLSQEEMKAERIRQKRETLTPLEDELMSPEALVEFAPGRRGRCVGLQARRMILTFVVTGGVYVQPSLLDGDFAICDDEPRYVEFDLPRRPVLRAIEG
ncbi:hypothetical protein BT69DRAFT_1286510 [Atractiella rhizophila]|nr:hypothetical protein BT69DRAFT_1286510 [Atractiella rhizophila]